MDNKTMWKAVQLLAAVLVIITLAVVTTIYLLFGGGKPYEFPVKPARLPASALEPVVVSDRPIGNAAVSAQGRIFFTIHPESHPEYPKIYEWVRGSAVPYPAESLQRELFESPLGVAIDALNRLWVIDPGEHGTGHPSLTAFSLDTNTVVHRHLFASDIAPLGSFLQDLQISTDGRWIYIADVGFWAKRPALIVYSTETGLARRLLNRHQSVYPQNVLIRNQIKSMSFFGGLLQMKTGIDGLALSRDNQWLYYAAMNHDTLYRIATKALQDSTLSEAQLARSIEVVGKKPLNDGLSIDDENNVFITDVEHQAVLAMDPTGSVATIIQDNRIRWADGLSFGPDGWLYLADSAIPHLVLQGPAHHAAQAPYYVWRFKPGTAGAPGQ